MEEIDYGLEVKRKLPLVVYVVVSALPRQALVEWQVAALDRVQEWQGLFRSDVRLLSC